MDNQHNASHTINTMNTTRDHTHYWLALNRIPGVGPVTAWKLLDHFNTPEQLFTLDKDELATHGIKPRLMNHLLAPDWSGVERDLAWLDEHPVHHLITPDDPRYPNRLKALPDRPIVLFVRGMADQLERNQLAMVGSRSPSPSGVMIAREFATALSHSGLTITSGLALGIDAAAHEGALAAHSPTFAVLGCGPDIIYPARHQALAARIHESGAIISEFVPGSPPQRAHFPRRNRLISGLSIGTLVVEATERSGSLITARLAGEQGREVFAVPGSIKNPQTRGCHRLIKDGAKLVEQVEDVLEELQGVIALKPALTERADPNACTEEQCEVLEPHNAEHAFLKQMGHDPVSIDALVRRSGLTASDVSSMLLTLELQGRVASQHGGLYQRLT